MQPVRLCQPLPQQFIPRTSDPTPAPGDKDDPKAFLCWTQQVVVQQRPSGSSQILAGIIPTSFFAATITFIPLFHNSVAALLAKNGSDTAVIHQAMTVYRVAIQGTTDVAHQAWTGIRYPFAALAEEDMPLRMCCRLFGTRPDGIAFLVLKAVVSASLSQPW
ncbi:hypothetical protein AC578_4044 [Pseudocercospora eumusae]|uniref:Uncharacterized protein n=1 Tax=Pseudocercospora eumusae TaxID=321146 RepID=A0A139HDV1_9PEZI|nr:hypothetical protein AC578_4044 [Pseudocercospora eumusae]